MSIQASRDAFFKVGAAVLMIGLVADKGWEFRIQLFTVANWRIAK
jgi:hypothetical protein